jgi:hypothetical protein
MALGGFGLLNKQLGGELGISEITAKGHRGQVMQDESELPPRSGENGRKAPSRGSNNPSG